VLFFHTFLGVSNRAIIRRLPKSMGKKEGRQLELEIRMIDCNLAARLELFQDLFSHMEIP